MSARTGGRLQTSVPLIIAILKCRSAQRIFPKNDVTKAMLTGITVDQVKKVISLLERISESRRAQTADGSRVSVDKIAHDPQRRELANYLYSLSGEARKELIALMLMGRGDVEHAYDRALETVRKYTAADDQVTYLMTKAFRLAEYLRIGLAAQADVSGPPDPA